MQYNKEFAIFQICFNRVLFMMNPHYNEHIFPVPRHLLGAFYYARPIGQKPVELTKGK